jgi:predicted RNA-binding protein associated with RNAse of E/G family
MWSSGRSVVLREVWKGRIWRAIAGRVIEDTDARTVLWYPRGSPSKFAARPDGTEIRIPCDEWTLADRTAGMDAVVEFRPGARHSVWTFRNPDGSLAYWYINLEQPLERVPSGFQSVDEKLDIVVEPDGTWRWKDEDELAEAARLGLVDARAVWAEARRVLADPPWPTGWEEWRQDPAWELPRLPEGWDVV